MPFAPHQRVTFRGLFDTTNNAGVIFEEWSFRLNFTNVVGDPGPAGNQQTLDDMAADATAFFLRPESKISAACVLTEVKAAAIGADGKYTGDARLSEVSARGAGGALRYPSQVAWVASLDTGLRGPRRRGRIYLPGPTPTLGGNTGRVIVAERNACGVSVATFLDNLNNRAGLDPEVHGRVCIASSFGINTRVTTVRVGDVLDTIRSRREQIPEEYSASLSVE